MNKLICRKCRHEISNEFGTTLAYCTNCGAGIQNLTSEKPFAFGNAPTPVSPKFTGRDSPSNSKIPRIFLGCLGLGGILLSVAGFFGNSYWSGKNPLAKFTNRYNCTIAGELQPKTPEEYVNRARKHIEDFSGDCAFSALNEAIRLDPNNADALRLRGYAYRLEKKYELALADYNKLIQIEPNNPDNFYARRDLYEAQELFDKAIEDQTTILNFILQDDSADNIKLIEGFMKRVELYEKKGDFENAVKDYSEAIRLNPESERHYYNRAEAYRKLGKNDLADADMKKIDELLPAKEGKKSTSSPSQTTQNQVPLKAISGGVLNGKAVELPQPAYPAAARAVRATGQVSVLVVVDETGNILSASAVTGHPLLRSAAVQAARQAKFAPTIINGKTVKVSGVITYNFSP